MRYRLITNLQRGDDFVAAGEIVDLQRDEARRLLASGAVERHLDDADDEPDGPALTDVSGIGKVAAGRLREAGVADLHALAALDDDALAALPEKLAPKAPAWRDEARELLRQQ